MARRCPDCAAAHLPGLERLPAGALTRGAVGCPLYVRAAAAAAAPALSRRVADDSGPVRVRARARVDA